MLRKFIVLLLTGLALGFSAQLWAEDDPIAHEEEAAKEVKDRPEWNQLLKEKYTWTDEQIAALKTKGLNYPQMAIAGQLALKSGKTIDEVVKMRTESKMGWGKIAKELGVAPKEIGQAVASMHHEVNANRHEDKAAEKKEKFEDKMAKKQEKWEHKQDKREERMQRRMEKHGESDPSSKEKTQ